jgi:hypothetical protein
VGYQEEAELLESNYSLEESKELHSSKLESLSSSKNKDKDILDNSLFSQR